MLLNPYLSQSEQAKLQQAAKLGGGSGGGASVGGKCEAKLGLKVISFKQN